MPGLVFAAAVLLLAASLPARAQTIRVRLPPPPAAPSGPVPATAPPAEEADVRLDEVRTLARDTRAALQDVVLRGALDPAITGRNTAPLQAVALEVGKDGETVGKAKLSWRLDNYDSAIDIVLRGPLNQSAGVPVTDGGLASGASATLGYNLTLWGSSVSDPAGSAARNQIANTGGASLSPLEALIATGIAVESRADRSYADATLQSLSVPQVRSAFAARDPRAIAFELRQAGTARLNRTLSLRGSYGVGSTTFTFAELADPLVEMHKTETNTSRTVSVAYVQLLKEGDIEAPLLLFSAGYTRSDAWKGARTRQVCTPLGLAAASECRALTIGAPTKGSVDSFEVDVRAWAYAQQLGVNPHFSRNQSTGDWSSEVSLSYLVLKEAEQQNRLPQLDAKALTVGLRVGSRPDDEGGMYAAVFFGTVLSR